VSKEIGGRWTWDNGQILNVGAVTLGLSNGSVTGPISSTHSVLGVVASDAINAATAYDPVRNQLVVGLAPSRRLVLHRTGVETSISIIGVGPDPAIPGQTVTFTALIAAMPAAPTDGEVVFSASTGERCMDATPAPISPTTAEYACSIAFATPGIRDVVAEYTGSLIHAYSGSSVATHTTVPPPLFADGFETR
jgi:hypothetical protein